MLHVTDNMVQISISLPKREIRISKNSPTGFGGFDCNRRHIISDNNGLFADGLFLKSHNNIPTKKYENKHTIDNTKPGSASVDICKPSTKI